jgi:hypothetical protein
MAIGRRRSAVKPIRFYSRDRGSAHGKTGYPIRVKSHDGFLQCQSTLLAEISAAALPSEPRPLRLKLEIGGSFLGKNVSMNYGAAAPGGFPEVSGVLLGRREGSRLHIVAFRPMTAGPEETEGVLFSDDWERAFGGLVARVRWDPKLAGLQLAGWFRAHPKTSLNLSRRDLQLFDRFFREPWQVGVILQPQDRSARGRFFLRAGEPSVDPFSCQDVMVRWNSQSLAEANVPAARAVTPLTRRPPEERDHHAKRPFWPAVLVAAAVAGTAWWMLRPPLPATPVAREAPEAAPAGASQVASQEAEALWKKWQSEARQQNANQPAQPDPLHDAAAGQPAPDLPKTPPPELEVAKTAPPKPELPKTQPPIPVQTAATRPPEPERKAPAPAPPPPRKTFVPPTAPATSASRSAAIETPPPALSASVQPDSTAHSVVLPPSATPAPPPRPVVREPARPPVPSSGRVIWTGHLRKNDLVVFEDGKASVGSLSGALPGVPVKVTVSPGDLTKDGITVYTARLRGSNGPAEAPGPQNGWNKTLYLWDPGRIADFEVTEAPNPTNGWKRLVLRAKNPHDSIVMVEWSAQP